MEDQRVAFEDFMTICRGTVEEADVTQVCAAAYQAELEAESGNWWQTLAQQVPPGILILFLLATLGGLYRYNLRLAGFHASRADLLELALIDPEMMRGKDGETLVTQLADALAADKVEFGKGNTPTDQAVAMAQAILNRK
ncbi:MAG: hypothetical protein CML68_00565 [Rhodobacteraceae bacterium]|nr:hypothetical protein [Paracoccaceae bacterium]